VCCERGVVVGWLCLPDWAPFAFAVTPGKRPIKAPLKRCTGGQSGDACLCLPVPACASLSLSRGRGAESAAMLRANREDSWDCRGRFPLRLLRPCLNMALLILVDMDLVQYVQSCSTPRYFGFGSEVEVTAPASRHTVGVLQFKCVASCPWAFGCACRHWPVLVRFKLLHLT
jgi:hypothetical protein